MFRGLAWGFIRLKLYGLYRGPRVVAKTLPFLGVGFRGWLSAVLRDNVLSLGHRYISGAIVFLKGHGT